MKTPKIREVSFKGVLTTAGETRFLGKPDRVSYTPEMRESQQTAGSRQQIEESRKQKAENRKEREDS
jgi:hypothetical protein